VPPVSEAAEPLVLDVIVASTRPARAGLHVAHWFLERAIDHAGFQVELVDLARVDLPLFDEPRHPKLRHYQYDHTKAWSAVIDPADAFVIITPEYNHGAPPALVNALDYLSQEWAYKPVGFVSYGGVSGGTRSVQMTKQIVSALKMVPLFEAVTLPFFREHLDLESRQFEPGEVQEKAAVRMLDELVRWATALRRMRAEG
jgi:NAD(P)H-dependent FMN reductase